MTDIPPEELKELMRIKEELERPKSNNPKWAIDSRRSPQRGKKAIPEEDVISALREAKGRMTVAASILGCSPHTIRMHRAGNPNIEAAFQEFQNRRTDYVEDRMLERIEEGSDKLIQYYLSTQAKDRGYGQQIEERGEVTVSISFVNDWRSVHMPKIYDSDDNTASPALGAGDS